MRLRGRQYPAYDRLLGAFGMICTSSPASWELGSDSTPTQDVTWPQSFPVPPQVGESSLNKPGLKSAALMDQHPQGIQQHFNESSKSVSG